MAINPAAEAVPCGRDKYAWNKKKINISGNIIIIVEEFKYIFSLKKFFRNTTTLKF